MNTYSVIDLDLDRLAPLLVRPVGREGRKMSAFESTMRDVVEGYGDALTEEASWSLRSIARTAKVPVDRGDWFVYVVHPALTDLVEDDVERDQWSMVLNRLLDELRARPDRPKFSDCRVETP